MHKVSRKRSMQFRELKKHTCDIYVNARNDTRSQTHKVAYDAVHLR